jgi:hypothetical protein
MGVHPNFPQAARGRTIALTGALGYPAIEPFAPLTVRSKALELILRQAPPSTAASLARLSAALADPGWHAGPDFPGLCDELDPYLGDKSSENKADEVAKARTEFAVYSRMIARMPAPGSLGAGGFVDLLCDTHRRLGTGISTLRDRAVRIRPDAAGNQVLFPHFSQCPGLLAHLHGFLDRHLAHYPALCATVTYAALIHAHPFNDGNGRTARTMYNLVLFAGTGTRHFVPVHLIAADHPGSLLIKLRRALYDGDWSGLQAFFADAGRLSIRLQRNEPGEAAPEAPEADKFLSDSTGGGGFRTRRQHIHPAEA